MNPRLTRLAWSLPLVPLYIILAATFHGWTLVWLTSAVLFAHVLGYAEGRHRRV